MQQLQPVRTKRRKEGGCEHWRLHSRGRQIRYFSIMIFVDSLGLVEVTILLVTAIVGLIYWAFIAPLSYWNRRGIANIPGVPLFGSLLDAITLKVTIGELYANIYHKEKGKKYIGFVKFNKPGILLRDPELIKNVLLRDFNSFHDNDISVDPHLDPLMARNIFVVAGESWKKIKAGVTPAFTSGKIKSIFPLIQEVCEELRTYIKEQVETSEEKLWEVEMKDMAARYTTEVVASCAFGLPCGSIRNTDSEFRRIGRSFLEPAPMNALFQLLVLMQPSVSRILRLRFFPGDITEFFRNIVKEMVSQRESTGISRNDFLNSLVQLSKAGKLGLEQEESENKEKAEAKNGEATKTIWTQNKLDDVAAQAVGFFTDGFETSSTTLGFFMLEMAHNPEIQERLRNEVKENIARHGGLLTYDGINEMKYMEMVFLETLRKYPPALSMTRICTKRYHLPSIEEGSEDDTKNGVWIEEGMPVVVPLYGLHHDPKYYPDPDKFDPERFTEENKRNRHRFVYLPIGEGPRICIGKDVSFRIKMGIIDVMATIGIILILAFIWYAIIPLAYWRRRKIPSAPALPFFGSMIKAAFLTKNLGEVITDIYYKGKGKKYISYHKFTEPAILLRDPEIIKNVLSRDFAHFNANDIQTEGSTDILSGRHLFVISGERWKRLRTVLSPGFSSGKMKAVFPFIADVCGNLRTYLTESIETSGDAGYTRDTVL